MSVLPLLGRFEWFGHNFAQTAHGVHFAIEGGGHVPVLRAELTDLQNERVGGDVNLSEHVVNVNGSFEFQWLVSLLSWVCWKGVVADSCVFRADIHAEVNEELKDIVSL